MRIAHRQNFWRDESGQSLLFAVLSMFAVAILVVMVAGVAETVNQQMRMQMAADSAAYAGAQVQADCIANIAWLNEAMAAIYYHSMRYAVDNSTYAVMAEMEDLYDQYPGQNKTIDLGFQGINGNAGRWTSAYREAEEWIPRGEKWLKRLSYTQRGIAVLTHSLVEHQARYTAKANGAERTAVYPSSLPYYDPRESGEPARRLYQIDRMNNSDGLIDWHIFSLVPAGEFDFLAEHRIQTESVPLWHIHSERNGQECDIREWHYEYDEGERGYTFLIVPRSGGEQKVRVRTDPESDVAYVFKGDESMPTLTINYLNSLPGGTADGYDNTRWVRLTYADGTRVHLRYDQENNLERWTDSDNDGRVDRNEVLNYGDRDSANINGVEVPVHFTQWITIDEGIHIWIGEPVTLSLYGELWVRLSSPIEVTYTTPGGLIRVNDNRATVNGLSTEKPDGRWYPIYYNDTASRVRHRMYTEGVPNQFFYEWVRTGTALRDMPMRKFAAHGIMDYDADYTGGARTDIDYWISPTQNAGGYVEAWPSEGYTPGMEEEGESDDARWQNEAKGRWERYPQWARPPREEAPYGGWFDISEGRPVNSTSYSLTRKCWYCKNQGESGSRLRDYYPGRATTGQMCVRPCGFWHEIYDSPAARQAQLLAYQNQSITAITFSPGPNRYGLQVECPVCEGWRTFDTAPTHESATVLQERPTLVRCYLYHGYERYKVLQNRWRTQPARVRRMDSEYDRNNDRDPESGAGGPRDFYCVYGPYRNVLLGNFSSINEFANPLELTDELLRHPFVVAVWNSTQPLQELRLRGDDGEYHQIGGSANAPGAQAAWANPIRTEQDGHFAVAAARLFFPYPPEQQQGGGATFRCFYEWPDVDLSELPRDSIDRLINPYRNAWLDSGFNLFETSWQAALLPINEAIDLRDYYTDGELVLTTGSSGQEMWIYTHNYEGDDGVTVEVEDNATTFLFRMLRRSPWRESVVHSGGGNRNADHNVWRSWRSVDWQDPDIQDVIHH